MIHATAERKQGTPTERKLYSNLGQFGYAAQSAARYPRRVSDGDWPYLCR
jgi:hypothetical protein